MDKSTFNGNENTITVPAECSMNMYTESGNARDVKNLEFNHAATDSWYHNGEKLYDYSKNTIQTGKSLA